MRPAHRFPLVSLLISLFAGLCACSPHAAPAKLGQQPSWRQVGSNADGTDSNGVDAPGQRSGADETRSVSPPPAPPEQVLFAPTGPSAAAYNLPFSRFTPESPLYQSIAQAIEDHSRRAGVQPPVLDPRLFAAADDMARVIPEERPLSYTIIEFALHRHGIIEPSPHLIPIAGSLDEPDAMVEQLAARLPELLGQETVARVGIGSARGDGPGRDVLVLLMQASHIQTNTIPRQLESRGRTQVEGTILGDYQDPEMFITRDDGIVVRESLERRGKRGFRVRLACNGRRGRQQVEITAHNARGSAVLANFPLWCGLAAPQSVTVQASVDDLDPVANSAEAEALMLRLVNRDRRQYGLAPLLLSPRLSDVARAHSDEMRDTGIVAHVSATTGEAQDRVHRAHIATSLVMENIARAYSVGEAEEGLMNSPGHRTNLLADKATHVGIGIALKQTEAEGRIMFFTQLFIREPPVLTAEQARTELGATIAKHPKQVATADDLSALAQAYADQVIAANLPDDQAAAWRAGAFQPFREGYAKIATAVVAVTDLETIDMDGAFSDAWITHYGLGVAKGPPSASGHDTLLVVLVLAQAR
jgi:uncharacterized protein YkwD